MKYYWILEKNPEDWDVTDALLAMGAVHVSTTTFTFYHVRRFIKQLTEEEIILLMLKYGHCLTTRPATEDDMLSLKVRGHIKS